MPFETFLSTGFAKDGYFTVMRQDNKWNLVHKDVLEPISEKWFDSVKPFSNEYAAVENEGKWNYVGVSGDLVGKKWFDEVKDFGQGFGVMRNKKTWSYVGEDGTVHGKYTTATSFLRGYAVVSIRKKYYVINKEFEKVRGPFDYATNILTGNTVLTRDKNGQHVELL